MNKLVTTLIGVVGSIGVSAIVFIGANKLFDLTRRRWAIFAAAVGGGIAFAVFAILGLNQLLLNPRPITVIATIIGATTGYLLGSIEHRRTRLAIGAGGGLGLGLLFGYYSQNVFVILADGTPVILPARPAVDPVALIVYSAVGAAVGWLLWGAMGRRGNRTSRIVLFASFGYLLAAWLMPDLDQGSRNDAMIAAGGVGLGFGAFAGIGPASDNSRKDAVQSKARSVIFMAPAMLFIGATLVVPTLRTLLLSVKDRRGDEFVLFDNYVELFRNPKIFNTSGWMQFFTSRLFYFGLAILLAGAILYILRGRRVGSRAEASPGSIGLWALGGMFLVTAALSVLRGTIFNNLWWVIMVTVSATALGLGIAVLADRGKYESLAKSIIFMPMAISFVGAGIIWRFMFQARQPTIRRPQGGQTGVLNSLWVALGQLSRSTWPKYVTIAILLAVLTWLLYLSYNGIRDKLYGIGVGAIVTAIPLIWFVYAISVGVGGWMDEEPFFATPILFIQSPPFNNLWLMVVLIWIQTGFTMVIFSAAIKAVPTEFIEASKVDGATESQSFWQVVIPQIAPTIGVVVTTLIVLVMKVFDIVKVMTNGNFDTQVIANEMWQRAFTELNFGLGSAIAVVLFLAVLPVLVANIRRMQKAAL